ncbi:MAG: hypothetical protein ACYTE3_02490 [Planctomycetota bacterium]|jgi:hypothetical protein
MIVDEHVFMILVPFLSVTHPLELLFPSEVQDDRPIRVFHLFCERTSLLRVIFLGGTVVLLTATSRTSAHSSVTSSPEDPGDHRRSGFIRADRKSDSKMTDPLHPLCGNIPFSVFVKRTLLLLIGLPALQ